LEDLVDFLEGDSEYLKSLTGSDLVVKSYQLISEPELQNTIASVQIMIKISGFLKELSEDNKFKTNIDGASLQNFISQMIQGLTLEKSEFVLNLVHFYNNLFTESISSEYLLSIGKLASDCI